VSTYCNSALAKKVLGEREEHRNHDDDGPAKWSSEERKEMPCREIPPTYGQVCPKPRDEWQYNHNNDCPEIEEEKTISGLVPPDHRRLHSTP
jgi:hypothetical protein